MGFSTTAAFMILFIFSIAVFGMVYNVVSSTAKLYVEELREKKEKIEESSNTRLEIVSLSTNKNGNGYSLDIVLKNSGTVTLKTEKFDVLVDGIKMSFTADRQILYPETQVTIHIDNLPGGENTNHRLKIVAENGYSIYTTYTVV